MSQHECLEGAIIDDPNTIAFRIFGSVGLGVEAMELIGEPFFISDECQTKASVFPIGFQSIED
jgi:hypothetical protein